MSYRTCEVRYYDSLSHLRKTVPAMDLKQALEQEDEYRKRAILYGVKHNSEMVLYSILHYDPEDDHIIGVSYFTASPISESQQEFLPFDYPHAEFRVLYVKACMTYCKDVLKEENSKKIGPITLDEANRFVKEHHRHHDTVRGCRFAVGLYKTPRNGDRELIGVAICGRPVSRYLDNGATLEINRLCVTEAGNSCSMLYGACVKIARDMGYEKVITYILESEDGTSLRASGFVLEDSCCGADNWTGARKRTDQAPLGKKQRWVKII